MAKITTITNPLTGQPAQVDQLDHTAQQIDDGIKRALEYGLGTTSVAGASYDANNCTRNGWYVCNVNTPNVQWWYILTVANYGNAIVVQKAWNYNGGKVIECMRLGCLDRSVDLGGGWQPWEYLNPPMQLGVEYRTTERYQGKPVYYKLVNFGALPNATSKEFEYSTETSCKFIKAEGNLEDGTGPVIPGAIGASTNQVVNVGGNGRHIWVVTYRDYSEKTAYIRVKYYKTTD